MVFIRIFGAKMEYRRLIRELEFLGRDPITFSRSVLGRLVFPLGPDWLWALKEWLRGRGRESARWLKYVTIDRDFGRAMRIPERARDTGFAFLANRLQQSAISGFGC